METEPKNPGESKAENYGTLIFSLIIATFFIYYFSNPKPQNYYDYTFRVAENFLHGAVGFTNKPPRHLNEFVPYGEYWYSVFPLGSVLTMIPFAFFKLIGAIKEMPAGLISALTASAICWFLVKITEKYEHSVEKKILLIVGILFGTWTWTNETMAGAWQLALGFAMLGELGAIYFTVYNRRPILAGLFFALAFGNRTEIILTAPIFMFLILNNFRFQISDSKSRIPNAAVNISDSTPRLLNLKSDIWISLAKFCIVPFILGVSTLCYNYVRFESFTDFGYARIPGVLDEPWYQHGIFSIWYIPDQAYQMLFKLWESRTTFPYLVPDGFSASILWSSPFILFIFRFGAREKILKYTSWIAIILLTFLLWLHGNAGGWQFGYRYAMVLLPWIFVILLENSPKKITPIEWAAYIISIIINAYATYLFHWTNYLKP
jgi:hypothetical protein